MTTALIILLLCLSSLTILMAATIPFIIAFSAYRHAWERQRVKDEAMERKARLEEARIAQMDNTIALTSLKIDQLRQKMGLDGVPFTPENYDGSARSQESAQTASDPHRKDRS